MKARVRAVWNQLHASYWFLPTIITLLSIGLSFGCLALDERIRYAVLRQQGWVYSGGPQGARAVLATIGGSIITVAGTTFSVTIAVLSMASAQFGPRLLRNFMRDRANQTVLGIFVATFLYCLLVLRTVRGTDTETYVPHLSVTVGVVLAVLCVAGLIFFIHHTAESIQVSRMLDIVGGDLDETVCRVFPEPGTDQQPASSLPPGEPRPIVAKAVGYLQEVDQQSLLEFATERDAVLRLLRRPGDYVIKGMTLADLWAPEELREDDTIANTFTLGLQRIPYQDPEFAFLQLVELAVRALSPGINDPFTAIMCIDRISAALCLLAERSLPPTKLLDEAGRLRILTHASGYSELVQAAFAQIAENGKAHAVIARRLREQIGVVLNRATQVELRMALEQVLGTLPAEEKQDRAEAQSVKLA